MNNHTLFVILGSTGTGKTDTSIDIAQRLNCSIISSDSRQIYRELKIGVATPGEEQLKMAKHFFIATRSITQHYSAGQYELDAIPIIESEIEKNGHALLVGGSMLYIDAICKGIDDIPNIDFEVRKNVENLYKREGIEGIRLLLKTIDPKHYQEVDLKNVKRILHAIEVHMQTGKKFSDFRKNRIKPRNFNMVKIGLQRERNSLYSRINSRVIEMIDNGLEQEVFGLKDMQHLNALNTVGYKELFAYFKKEYDLPRAIELIQRNTRHYARKQMSWFGRDKEINWFFADDKEKIFEFIEQKTAKNH